MFKVVSGGRVGNIMSIHYEITITHVFILVHYINDKYVIIFLWF